VRCGGEDHRGSNGKATATELIKWKRHKIYIPHTYFNRPKTAMAQLSDITDVIDATLPLETASESDDIKEVIHDFEPNYMVRSPSCPAALIITHHPAT
jgi:hypothetical protein